MCTHDSITEFILELEKSNSLELKIKKDKLSELADSYFTGREIYGKK